MTLFVGDCRRCGAQKMSFDVYGVSTVDAAEPVRYGNAVYSQRTIELACSCRECNRTSIFVFQAEKSNKHDLPPLRFEANENPLDFEYKLVGGIPAGSTRATPADTPKPADQFFEQAASAMAHGLHDAAGAMCRKCLESVTRSATLLEAIPETERDAFKALWLKARITKLKELHVIPPALADLVDVIKDEGDGAVHDDAAYDKDSAEAVMGFTETFLEQMFTIPAQIAQVRKKKK